MRITSDQPKHGPLFMHILTTWIIYAVLGALGLSLSIPPGYASPVFPAAGMAVSFALYYGNRILPGIWLGSLTINLFVAWQNGMLNTTSILVAAFLATGATVQAWVARIAVVRWSGVHWHRLESEKDIALFLGVAAPLACLVSATMGVTTLHVAGIIPMTGFFFSWWNWWVGDTLGVFIFAPLALIFLLRGESPWKERQTAVAVPMLMTLCLVASVFIGVSHWENGQLTGQIEDQGKKLAQLLDRRLVAHQEALSSLRRLIEVTPDMTFKQFEYFTRITLQDNKDIFALSYNPVVHFPERTVFEQSIAKKFISPAFKITERNSKKELIPAAVRPDYVVVGYIAPIEGNRPAIGFDINSEPIRRAAINCALNSGKPAVTAPIQLVQESLKRVGVLVLHPAYRNTQNVSAVSDEKPFGFAVGVIKVDELVQIATQNEIQPGMTFHLTDPVADQGRRILFQSDGGKSKPMGPYIWRTQLTMADRKWSLDVFPTMDYLHRQRSWLAWTMGIVGLAFTAMMQLIMLAMTGRTFAIKQKVNEKTEELTHARDQLEILNRSLQQRVDEAVAELRQKDQVMINQGRQAAMGEMIGNIAHQWRQPLNALTMLMTNLQFAYKENELTEIYMNESAENAHRLIQKMSTTINDFRNFFSPDKEIVPFSALQQIRTALTLVETAFKNNHITISIDARNDCTLYGFPNEYSQVLLNLLNNAKDAITETGSMPGCITITLEERVGMGCVTIKDNGGGIPEAVLGKIFEPYFSTKNMGTGVGLYMSKMIIERNMKGTLTARTFDGGSEFSIKTPMAVNKS